MKKAGDLLSAILDEKTLGRAREYSRLFSVWEQLNTKHGIAAAANHSRVQDIRHGVLVIEADHPGWIQILQTKEQRLLADLQNTFPDLSISGIAFRLSKTPAPPAETDNAAASEVRDKSAAYFAAENPPPKKTTGGGYEKIKNKELAEKLKNLEKSIVRKNQ